MGNKLLSLCAALLLSCQPTTEGVVHTTPAGIKVESVFKIWVSKDGLGGGYGSAVAYKINHRDDMKYDLYLLTAAHNLSLADANTFKIVSTLEYGLGTVSGDLYDFETVSKNTDLDVCVIKSVVPRYFRVSELDTEPPATGQQVAAIGYPLGLGITITDGYVCFTDFKHLAVSCDAFFGSSGGGVFNPRSGKLIGILVSIVSYRNATGGINLVHFISYVTPVDLIKQWMDKEGLT